MVDRVRYEDADGSTREIAVADFLALPLLERVQGVMEHKFQFYRGAMEIPADDALAALRLGQVTPAGPLRVHSRDEHHMLGACEGVLISVWRKSFAVEVVERLGRYRTELVPFVGTLHIAEASASLPKAAERAAMMRVFAERAPGSPPVALVLVGGGFGVSALRGIATAVFAMRPDVPKRIFAEVGDAIPWLAERMGRPDLTERLRQAVAAGRRVGT